MKLEALKNLYTGMDIYVLGSGPSLGFIDPEFFACKIVICINHTINHVPKALHLYLVAKEPTDKMQREAHKKNATLVMCKHHSGLPHLPVNVALFPNKTVWFNAKQDIAGDTQQNDSLERSSSTIVSGIHLAAFMGAKNIILVGHDCGSIDNQSHVPGYSKEKAIMKGDHAYKKWMVQNKVEAKTLKLKKILKDKWKANVYSLNPFINYNLEGHTFRQF